LLKEIKLKESTIINYRVRLLPGFAIALLLFPLLVSAPLPSAFAQSQTLLLKNARIRTMGGPGLIENGMILVEGGKIKKIGRDITAPPGAEVLDLSGKTVIPGLVCATSSLFLYERDLSYAERKARTPTFSKASTTRTLRSRKSFNTASRRPISRPFPSARLERSGLWSNSRPAIRGSSPSSKTKRD